MAQTKVQLIESGAVDANNLADTTVTAGSYTTTDFTVDAQGRITAASSLTGQLGNRNKIINGDMRIDQRNSGASVSTTGGFPVDRWLQYFNGGGVYSAQRSTTAPAGFANSLALTVTTADASIVAGDYYMLRHKIEGYNVDDLKWGTADARTVTLSFWVRSSVTGTYGASFTTGAEDRGYAFNYSISAADTWEYKTITIAGDTAGTWFTDNRSGLNLNIALGMSATYSATPGSWTTANNINSSTGATNWISTNGATFYITGVQLEVGDKATPFEHRSYGDELARCQRYYQRPRVIFYGHVPAVNNSATANSPMFAEMRADPTASLVTAHTTSNISTTYPPATVGVLKNGWVVRVVVDSTNVAWYSATWQLSSEL